MKIKKSLIFLTNKIIKNLFKGCFVLINKTNLKVWLFVLTHNDNKCLRQIKSENNLLQSFAL